MDWIKIFKTLGRMVELYNGDCLKEMSNISDSSVDMIIADLPYGMTACKWDSIIPLEPMWKEFKRITKLNSPMVFTTIQPFTTVFGNSNIKNLKLLFLNKNLIINSLNLLLFKFI